MRELVYDRSLNIKFNTQNSLEFVVSEIQGLLSGFFFLYVFLVSGVSADTGVNESVR